MKNKIRNFAIMAMAAIAGNCMGVPFNHQVFEKESQGMHDNFTFSGTLLVPDGTVQIQVKNQNTGIWEVIGQGQSSEDGTPAYGGNLYAWTIQAPISSATDPQTWCRWTPNCDAPSQVDLTAFIRARAGGISLYTYEEGAIEDCIDVEEDSTFYNFLTTAAGCSSPDSPIVTIHWQDDNG